MTETYFPFDSGAGANVMENQWSLIARHWLQTGVIRNELNNLQVIADSSGMQVKVESGMAMMRGHFYQNDTEVVLPISSADATNARIDRIILRLDWTANTIKLTVLQGTPAATPAAPALTQNTSMWEVSLAQVNVPANAATIASGNVTDERTYATALIDAPTTFGNLLSGNGWQKLPNGLILQWGTTPLPTTLTANSQIYVDCLFPITFPNACLFALHDLSGQDANSNTINLSHRQPGLTPSKSTIRVFNFSAVALATGQANFLAIGY